MSNTYSYAVSLVLKDQAEPLKSAQSLSLQNVIYQADTSSLVFLLTNPEAQILDDLHLDIKILQDDKQVIHHKSERLQMAPNTKMNYSIPVDKLNGTYQISLTASSYQQQWDFKEQIHVEEKKPVLKSLLQEKPGLSTLKIVISTIGIVSVIVLLITSYVMRKQREEDRK